MEVTLFEVGTEDGDKVGAPTVDEEHDGEVSGGRIEVWNSLGEAG